jgi:hypothetical protein
MAASALFVAASVGAQTVSLELKTGDRITGQIISETNNRVVLSNGRGDERLLHVALFEKLAW